jgi:hypothetical protein
LWITAPATWAVTHWSVLNSMTFCSWTTWVSYQTWVLATLTDTRLVSQTFRIWCALRLRWNCFKILKLLISNICFKNFYITKTAEMVELSDVELCLTFSVWPVFCCGQNSFQFKCLLQDVFPFRWQRCAFNRKTLSHYFIKD